MIAAGVSWFVQYIAPYATTAISEEEVGIYGGSKKDTENFDGKVKGRNHAQDTGVNKRRKLK
jgi:hypothetical protein